MTLIAIRYNVVIIENASIYQLSELGTNKL